MITGLYAALVAILMVIVGVYIVSLRIRHQVSLGDGGEKTLEAAQRALGNTAEWLPTFLILMWVAEYSDLSANWLHGVGIIMVLGRVSHAFSLIVAEQKLKTIRFRQFGMFAMWLPMLLLAVYLIKEFFIF